MEALCWGRTACVHESRLLYHVVSCDYVSLCLSFGRCVDLSSYVCVCLHMCLHVCLFGYLLILLPIVAKHTFYYIVLLGSLCFELLILSLFLFLHEKKKLYMIVARMRAIACASLFCLPECLFVLATKITMYP